MKKAISKTHEKCSIFFGWMLSGFVPEPLWLICIFVLFNLLKHCTSSILTGDYIYEKDKSGREEKVAAV